MQYSVIKSEDLDWFLCEVNRYTQEIGWELSGGIAMTFDPLTRKTTYAQAVYRPKVWI